MKTALVAFFVAGSLVIFAGCADESTASSQDDRIGGRTGVNMPSRDMSRVAPEHTSQTPPAS